jgi:type I restriction enzyme S subunit
MKTMNNPLPKLRFPEFQEKWEEKRLGDIGEFTGGGTPSKDKNDYWNGNIPWISSSDISEESIHEITISRFITKEAIQESATKIVPANSILLVSRVGVGKLAVTNKPICTSQDFTNLTPTKDNLMFLGYYLKSRKEEFLSFNQGMAIKGFTKKDIEALKTFLPNPTEQQKIANCLTSLDELITAQSQKVSALKTYKKGLMQNLFPADSESLPRLRFPEFQDAGEWGELPLGEVGEIITGKTPSTTDSTLWNGEIQFVTPTDIKDDEKYQYKTQRTVSFTEKIKVLPKHSIMFTCIASIGKMAISVSPCITNQQINTLITKNNFDNEYVYYALLSITDYIKSTQASSTLPIINKTEFSKFLIPVPSQPEQQKIAEFLTSIDEQITAQSETLEMLKSHKKGLMQGLFPSVKEA